MDEFSVISAEGLEGEKSRLETELEALLRKMWSMNIYTPERVDSIIRGLRYEESLGLPPPCERH